MTTVTTVPSPSVGRPSSTSGAASSDRTTASAPDGADFAALLGAASAAPSDTAVAPAGDEPAEADAAPVEQPVEQPLIAGPPAALPTLTVLTSRGLAGRISEVLPTAELSVAAEIPAPAEPLDDAAPVAATSSAAGGTGTAAVGAEGEPTAVPATVPSLPASMNPATGITAGSPIAAPLTEQAGSELTVTVPTTGTAGPPPAAVTTPLISDPATVAPDGPAAAPTDLVTDPALIEAGASVEATDGADTADTADSADPTDSDVDSAGEPGAGSRDTTGGGSGTRDGAQDGAGRTEPIVTVAGASGISSAGLSEDAVAPSIPGISGAAAASLSAVLTEAAAEAPRTPLGPGVADLARSMVRDGTGVARIVLRLDPPELGSVNLTLTLRAGEVHVSLVAGDLAAAAALDSRRADVRAALSNAGLDLDGYVVSTDSRDRSSQGSPGDREAPARGRQGQATSSYAGVPTEDTAAEPKALWL